jgi:hypothetical protein
MKAGRSPSIRTEGPVCGRILGQRSLLDQHRLRRPGERLAQNRKRAPLYIDGMRILAVCILGPTAEELLFRGLLYGALTRTRLKVAGSVFVAAIGWALMHTAYSPAVIALLFVGGLLLGAARYRTKSVIVPIAMHIVWNLYAIW